MNSYEAMQSVNSQLARSREAAASLKAGQESIERNRLQRDNERLLGEVVSLRQSAQASADEAARLRQQLLGDEVRAAIAKSQPAIEAALNGLQRAANPPPDLSKLSATQLIQAGLEIERRASAGAIVPAAPSQPATPAPAANAGPDLSKMTPTQLIQAGLAQDRARGG